jgi:hypothetical protein
MGQVETPPGQGQKLLATLDEVAVYAYVLSPRQVKQRWAAASTPGAQGSFEHR